MTIPARTCLAHRWQAPLLLLLLACSARAQPESAAAELPGTFYAIRSCLPFTLLVKPPAPGNEGRMQSPIS